MLGPLEALVGRVCAVAVVALAIAACAEEKPAKSLAPPHPGYARLQLALARYRSIAAQGSWSAVPGGAALLPGDTGARVSALRTRLALEGDLVTDDTAGNRYDAALEQAVRRFQARHGLEEDGEVGPRALAALNVPVENRIQQMELNLERWRSVPRELGERYIMVNAAAFELQLVEGGQAVMTLRAVVGRPDRPTPIFSARMTGVLFAPPWHIPGSIAAQELLPIIRRDPAYLERERIRVFRDRARKTEVDPATIDWWQVSESTFAFHLRQEPGSANPLGGVKFVFANRFDTYIHDTPARDLFRKRVRAFSHGCVRVERADDLARRLLGDQARWPRDSVRAAMGRAVERWVALAEPVPVHLVYWTAWAREDGTVEFRDDVYGWDVRLAPAPLGLKQVNRPTTGRPAGTSGLLPPPGPAGRSPSLLPESARLPAGRGTPSSSRPR